MVIGLSNFHARCCVILLSAGKVRLVIYESIIDWVRNSLPYRLDDRRPLTDHGRLLSVVPLVNAYFATTLIYVSCDVIKRRAMTS
jgi:hypothetical protein